MTSTTTTPLRLAYGTNGLTDLRLNDALALLADLGYDGVSLTLDHMHLDPLAPGLAARTADIAHRLAELGLSVAVETGARYVLDPYRKHHPTLLDPDPEARAARTGLLCTAVRVAADLGARAVHCFSGVRPDGTSEDTAWHRLAGSLGPVLAAAADSRLPLALEPEPGHLVCDLASFHYLRAVLGGPQASLLGLTLDIGHCQCLEPDPPATCVRAAAPWLWHVQIEDMRRGVHEHLPFGTGEIDFPPVLDALKDVGYQGLVSVELPRHSHAGPQLAASSLHFLRSAEQHTIGQHTIGPHAAGQPTAPQPTAPQPTAPQSAAAVQSPAEQHIAPQRPAEQGLAPQRPAPQRPAGQHQAAPPKHPTGTAAPRGGTPC